MKQRTLKEVAQAGLVLGFEWIAKDGDGEIYFFAKEPTIKIISNGRIFWGIQNQMFILNDGIKITDYPHAPEKWVLKLSDIVESN